MSDRVVGKLKSISSKYMKEGVEKNRWIDVGKLMIRDDGSMYVLLLKHINLAGFLAPDGSDSITAVLFKETDEQRQERAKKTKPYNALLDDDTPF